MTLRTMLLERKVTSKESEAIVDFLLEGNRSAWAVKRLTRLKNPFFMLETEPLPVLDRIGIDEYGVYVEGTEETISAIVRAINKG